MQDWSSNRQILSTQSTTSEKFTRDEKAKAALFFARIQTIYGVGRCGTLWGDEDELKLMRREWAKALGGFAIEQLEEIFTLLKLRLACGDPEFRFPDIARILGLLNEPKRDPAHTVFRKGLPEPEWRKKQRIECGRLASKTCLAVLKGAACFVEDKPDGE